jgi:hypothetical protein
MSMQHKLPGGPAGGSEPEAVDNVIHPHLEELKQHLTRYTTLAEGTLEEEAELPFLKAVEPPQALLLPELQPILRRLL